MQQVSKDEDSMKGIVQWPSSRPSDRGSVTTVVAPLRIAFSIQGTPLGGSPSPCATGVGTATSALTSPADLFRMIELAQTETPILTQPANPPEAVRSWKSLRPDPIRGEKDSRRPPLNAETGDVLKKKRRK